LRQKITNVILAIILTEKARCSGMKTLSFFRTAVGFAIIFYLGCFVSVYPVNTDAEKQQKEAPHSQTNTNEAENNGIDYYSSAGFDLMLNESAGFLKNGLLDTKVLELLGKPEEKSKVQMMGYDGENHQTWYYKAKGIELDLIGNTNAQKVNTITISSPCAFKTKRNIGLGSTKKEVLNAYKNEIDLSGVNPETNLEPGRLVAGTIYGGVIFSVKNDRVDSIFIGAAAE
jgi:hypothetical protein